MIVPESYLYKGTRTWKLYGHHGLILDSSGLNRLKAYVKGTTVEPRSVDTPSLWTPLLCGHFLPVLFAFLIWVYNLWPLATPSFTNVDTRYFHLWSPPVHVAWWVHMHHFPSAGMWLRSQSANFSQFWSIFSCHLWDQCKSSEKMLPCLGGGGLCCSGTAFQMLRLQDVSAHFSQFPAGPVSSLVCLPVLTWPNIRENNPYFYKLCNKLHH